MRSGNFSVQIRPKARSVADEYLHKGRTYIEGRHNSNYVIELINHSNVSAEAVLSVDGLAVTDGELASYASRGFVIQALGSITVEGWLLNSQQAAQFVFGGKSNSYASQSNKDGNQGVIGVAWFFQKPVIMPRAFVTSAQAFATPWIGSMVMGQSGNMGPQGVPGLLSQTSVSNASVTQSMGTSFGESVDFGTTSVAFERATQDPSEVQLIYYDSADNLQKMGIRLKSRISNAGPQAFPLSTGYCKPPPGWTNKTW